MRALAAAAAEGSDITGWVVGYAIAIAVVLVVVALVVPILVLAYSIGNAILLLIVVPVLVALLNRVLAALERIRRATDDILDGGVALTGELDDVPEMLAVTDDTVRDVTVGAVRYAGSVAKLLG